MPLTFRYRQEKSSIFGTIYRPVAKLSFWSARVKNWETVWMIVDTGADYSLLPRYLARDLGIELSALKAYATHGIGGKEKVYLAPKIKVKLGVWEREVPVGFLNRDDVPPLLGRHLFLEAFEVHFSKNHTVSFDK